jgi:hypothetical protein
MFNPNEYELSRNRYADLDRQITAQEAAQAHHAARGDQAPAPFYAEGLSHLGKLLVQVGENLQERYGQQDLLSGLPGDWTPQAQ